MEISNRIRLACAGLVAGALAGGCAAGRPSGIQAAGSVSEFQVECAKRDASFSMHDCSGKNSCKGFEYQDGKAVGKHGCKGQSSCKGATCRD